MNIITIDKDAFLVEVHKYLDISPIAKEWNDVKTLKFPTAFQVPQVFTTIKEVYELVSVVCSSVEIAKTNILAMHPEGSKIDKVIALTTAVSILAKLVKFEGFFGAIINRVGLNLILNTLCSLFISGQPVNWINIALQILGIALTPSVAAPLSPVDEKKV